MGRCDAYPRYVIPHEERDTSNEAAIIHFPIYRKTTQCTIRDILADGMKAYPQCSTISNVEGDKTRKFTIHKVLADICTEIGTCYKD